MNAADLSFEVIAEGDGETAKNGMQVSVHYQGRLTDGTVFDDSQKRGTPFSFTLGSGQVIPGWEQGIVGMKIGEKRVLTIPPELGYGAAGAGGVIPPNATLVFDVELVSVAIPPKLGNATAADFKAAQKNGPDACPFNYLYWDFLARNRNQLKSNHRMGMMYRTYDKMDEAKKQAIEADSQLFLEAL